MGSQSFFSKTYNQLLLTVILVGAVVALGAYAYLTFKEAQYVNVGPTTFTVVGEGEVLARPDIGQFSFSVEAEGEDAASAQEDSATKINTILSYLEEAGVAEADIKTQNYNLNPQYRYEENVCPLNQYCPPGERILDGYVVSQRVEVKVRDLESAGDLIAGVGQREATNISNLSFTIDDDAALKAEARGEAIADAKAKAEQLADDLDVRIVKMVNFHEDEQYPPMPYGRGGDDVMEQSAAFDAPQLPTGENSTISRVRITYEVK